MSLFDSVRKIFVPIHKEGYPFLLISAAATLVLGYLWSPFGWIGSIITLWIAYFFRDPVRTVPQDPSLIVAPADGRLSMITDVVPPVEMELGDEPLTRVSIFMNVFNCHVNRVPVAGRIRKIVYKPGLFLNAELDKASENNERNLLVVDSGSHQIGVIQIAGLIARRIVSFVREGDSLNVGERFGLIRFGSRVDVFLPKGVTPLVAEGQTIIAGETVLARLSYDSLPVTSPDGSVLLDKKRTFKAV
jgi:phosphatidylserine decarboxylase